MRFAPLFLLFSFYYSAPAQEATYPKVFFDNSVMQGRYFFSGASYQSPGWVNNIQQRLPVCDTVFFTPGNALELSYVSTPTGSWQAKVLNHNLRGVDSFKSATHLLFWLYAASATTAAQLPQLTIELPSGRQTEALPLQRYVPIVNRQRWQAVRIPLADFDTVITAATVKAIVFAPGATGSQTHHLYIDQLELGTTQAKPVQSKPRLTTATGYERHVDITWQPVADTAIRYVKIYRSINNRQFYPVGIRPIAMNRYTDFTDTTGRTFYYRATYLNHFLEETAPSNTISAATHPMTDSALLDMVQEAHFCYYWEGAEKWSGLALENKPGKPHMVAAGASGFGLMALLVAAERHFITHAQLLDRFDRITLFLQRAETFHGAFPHFIDGRTGKVVPFFGPQDNGGDLVETAFLMQGILAARQYFTGTSPLEQTIHRRLDSLWKGVEWSWYRREPASPYLYWHWSPDQAWVINHRLIGWNETMITYLLGIASPTYGVPANMYYSGWASQSAYASEYRTWGQSKDGLKFTNGNTYYGVPLAVGVSSGGPLFFTHYSFMGPDPHYIQDAYTNYFENNRNIALINYRYCLQNPEHHLGYGAGAWGLTASDGPWDYSADEPAPAADHDKITPTGALASFPYTPAQSMAALKNYYRNKGRFLWGEYGFRDAYNEDENWCPDQFVGLNQAPITVMIENYRSGLIWRLFMSSPEIQTALQKLAREKPVKE
jgi:exo beta-1,2-glucooligosaccharide sophorohydrolase (non-reducing end)